MLARRLRRWLKMDQRLVLAEDHQFLSPTSKKRRGASVDLTVRRDYSRFSSVLSAVEITVFANEMSP